MTDKTQEDKKMKKLRLLLFSACNRSCEGCCNKQFDLTSLSVERDFSKYRKVILTGGEPMLKPEFVKAVIKEIRSQTDAPINLYTAKVDDRNAVFEILEMIEGITVTLHEPEDIRDFYALDSLIKHWGMTNKSLRLNVFKGVVVNPRDFLHWQVKTDIEWIKDCPLPTDEVFCRYE